VISVIIPTYNEELYIGALLSQILGFNVADDIEVLIVDGGSSDRTLQVASNFEDLIILNSEKGRSKQMNLGAKEAHGDVLFFLHADSSLPKNSFELIRKSVKNKPNCAGTFYLEFDKKGFWYSLYSRCSRIKHPLVTYGDQGLFIRKKLFFEFDGFPDVPILEDYFLIRQLYKKKSLIKLNQAITTSSRRFEKSGVIRQQLKNILIILAYYFGVPNQHLAKWYYKS